MSAVSAASLNDVEAIVCITVDNVEASRSAQRRGNTCICANIDSKLDFSTGIWNDSWNERVGHFLLGHSFCLRRDGMGRS